MNIRITQEAADELKRRYGAGGYALRLVYDTEGCGCAVNGVPQLQVVEADEAGLAKLRQAADEPVPLLYDPLQEIYFEDTLTLGFQPNRGAFRLASAGQIYSADLVPSDRRN
ncbi:hypothetical protein J31TS4_06280 [Paenibacillus sp. J31TS4]|uniref:iron-sulfur cluster biosynthesis family protein n=1 Tax=Paenibacillus sp. J31TS4 TaxID=2807195 RepID=UPI001B1445A2|nr:iron-sulfur cluster biosynthesis family protein [Paenibacillus sp. J31TS4]GIP37348.1 hypothetical protein J31TS4_06280 [Paenibacillus sp. J31TS4]